MFATALVVFREVLEAALLVGVVAAAARGAAGRGAWLAGGLAVGLLGAALVAAGADVIARLADGIGQELFNVGVLAAAVLMLAWHNLWMAAHGQVMAREAHRIGDTVRAHQARVPMLLGIVALAILREGTETVLFLYGIAASGASGTKQMAAGGLLGVAAGVVVGFLLYAGLLRVPVRWFFATTSALVLFLAASMASQAAGFLIQANLLPSLSEPIWDTSAWIPGDSALGVLLHALVGYVARPAGMQIVFYVSTLALIGAGTKWANRRCALLPRRQRQQDNS